MAVLQALREAVGALGRNPLLFVVVAAFGLLQLPSSVAQSIDPFVGAAVSLGVSGIAIIVTPFSLGGVVGMANEMLDGRALVFTSVTRNSLVVLPLALALPPGYPLAPAVVVTQTLVELVGMVVLTRVVPRWLVPDPPKSPARLTLASRD